MKSIIKKILLVVALLPFACSPAYVGVGVHVPGAWGPPYRGGGTVVIGRPLTGQYYPALPNGSEFGEFVVNGKLSSTLQVDDKEKKIDKKTDF